FPEAGSTYTYTAKALRPAAGFFAGWALMLDYILIPMLSVIFVGLTANKVWPETPYWLWASVAAAGITAINLGGIRVTSRANYLTNAIMVASLVWFIAVAIKALHAGVGEGVLFSTRPFFDSKTFAFGDIVNTASLAVLSFIGFDGISTLAEDAKD